MNHHQRRVHLRCTFIVAAHYYLVPTYHLLTNYLHGEGLRVPPRLERCHHAARRLVGRGDDLVRVRVRFRVRVRVSVRVNIRVNVRVIARSCWPWQLPRAAAACGRR